MCADRARVCVTHDRVAGPRGQHLQSSLGGGREPCRICREIRAIEGPTLAATDDAAPGAAPGAARGRGVRALAVVPHLSACFRGPIGHIALGHIAARMGGTAHNARMGDAAYNGAWPFRTGGAGTLREASNRMSVTGTAGAS